MVNCQPISNNLFIFRFPLYTKLSDYLTVEEKPIGYGLFSTVDILKDTKFVIFNGEKVTIEKFNSRKSKGKGGYGVKIDKTTILDCYEKANTRECLASMGNSPLNLASPYPQANAKLVIRNGKAYLVAITDIEKDCEIFYNYGSIYQMI